MTDTNSREDYRHISVMTAPVMQYLKSANGNVIVDCTLGGSGHASGILKQIAPDGLLIGIDRDPAALENAQKRLPSISEKFMLFRGSFADLPEFLAAAGVPAVDGILADLGLSLYQIEQSGRGFSFRLDEPLDMRMDTAQPLTAHRLVNQGSEAELGRIFREYGEERFAKRIARRICQERERQPLNTSKQLANIVCKAIPANAGKKQSPKKSGKRTSRKIHPATRVFMALRIAVNSELDTIERFMADAPRLLRPGGRLCVITFHSLEDRIVKHAIRELSQGCNCPKYLPACVCGRRQVLANLTRKGVRPTDAEIAANPMSRSATLRAAEKLQPDESKQTP